MKLNKYLGMGLLFMSGFIVGINVVTIFPNPAYMATPWKIILALTVAFFGVVNIIAPPES